MDFFSRTLKRGFKIIAAFPLEEFEGRDRLWSYWDLDDSATLPSMLIFSLFGWTLFDLLLRISGGHRLFKFSSLGGDLRCNHYRGISRFLALLVGEGVSLSLSFLNFY